MARYQIEHGRRTRGTPATRIALLVLLLLLLIGARSLASYAIEIRWWKEVGQFNTWLSMLTYSLAPVGVATLLAFAVLWMAHARALKFAGTGLGEHRTYARASALVLLLVGYLIAVASVDTWTVVRFAGSRGLPPAATVWHDAVFAKPLSFYLFDLPFYTLVRSYVLALAILCILLYWIAARGWQLRHRIADFRCSASKVAWNRNSCAVRPWFCCWRWRCVTFWAATRWFTTSTGPSWWESIMLTRTSVCLCNGW